MPSQYRIEVSPNRRAGCSDTKCKKEEIKIQTGELRFGSWFEIGDHGSWKYKHWGCVSGLIIQNLRDQTRQDDGTYDFDRIDGFDEMGNHPHLQQKIRLAIIKGKIADEDFNGDPGWNVLGKRGIHGRAKKANDGVDGGNEQRGDATPAGAAPPKKAAKKRDRKDRKKASDDKQEEDDDNGYKDSVKLAGKNADSRARTETKRAADEDAAVDTRPAKKARSSKVKKEEDDDGDTAREAVPAKSSKKNKVKTEEDHVKKQNKAKTEEDHIKVKKGNMKESKVKKENSKESKVKKEDIKESKVKKEKDYIKKEEDDSGDAALEDVPAKRSKKKKVKTEDSIKKEDAIEAPSPKETKSGRRIRKVAVDEGKGEPAIDQEKKRGRKQAKPEAELEGSEGAAHSASRPLNKRGGVRKAAVKPEPEPEPGTEPEEKEQEEGEQAEVVPEKRGGRLNKAAAIVTTSSTAAAASKGAAARKKRVRTSD